MFCVKARIDITVKISNQMDDFQQRNIASLGFLFLVFCMFCEVKLDFFDFSMGKRYVGVSAEGRKSATLLLKTVKFTYSTSMCEQPSLLHFVVSQTPIVRGHVVVCHSGQ
jgi:hypothetical protein